MNKPFMGTNPISKSFEKGQSLTELALTITFIIVLLAGIVDLGHAIYIYITIRDAAQEGAAYADYGFSTSGSVTKYCSDIISRAKTQAEQASLFDSAKVNVVAYLNGVECNAISSSPCANDEIKVDVTYHDFPITMPFLGSIVGTQTISMTASVKDNILIPICP
jgi:Flp pilus assembly protein TadG